jgi:hypothetical protein
LSASKFPSKRKEDEMANQLRCFRSLITRTTTTKTTSIRGFSNIDITQRREHDDAAAFECANLLLRKKDETAFKLSDEFVDRYAVKPAPFGFNGLGELVYMRA